MSPIVWGVLIGVVVALVLMRVKGAWRSPAALAAAREALAREGRLVDVRGAGEFAAHHARGAVNVPVADVVAGRHAALGPKDRPLLVYCASGARSAVAASALRRAGYTEVRDLGTVGNASKVAG